MSPILFNIALEGLLQLLADSGLGYPIAGSSLHSLAYADDLCVIAASRTQLQSLLDRCVAFTSWAGLTFNPKKCGSLSLVNKKSPIYVASHIYSLGLDPIPALAWGDRYKYLGCPIGATNVSDLTSLWATLLHDCTLLFASPLAEWQKLDAFKRFIFPRLPFALKVLSPGVTWAHKLDSAIRKLIKVALKLPVRACTQFFYTPQALGGLGIPSVEDELHASRASQAFHFLGDTRDPAIRQIALHQLRATVEKRAPHLDSSRLTDLAVFLNSPPAQQEGNRGDLKNMWSMARDSLALCSSKLLLTDTSVSLACEGTDPFPWSKRRQGSRALKASAYQRHLHALLDCEDQGRAIASLQLHPSSNYWVSNGAFLSFPQYRFALKSRLNLLLVKTVQARCGRPITNTSCRLCHAHPETLSHVLNHCTRNLGMVRDRHNTILDRLVRATPESLGSKFREQPLPGTTGNNRPDLTIISPDNTSVILVDVTMPFEGSPSALEEAAATKIAKYQPLCHQLSTHFASVKFLPFVIGSLGSWFPGNEEVLKLLHIGHRYAILMRKLCVSSAIGGSRNIWYTSMCTKRS